MGKRTKEEAEEDKRFYEEEYVKKLEKIITDEENTLKELEELRRKSWHMTPTELIERLNNLKTQFRTFKDMLDESEGYDKETSKKMTVLYQEYLNIENEIKEMEKKYGKPNLAKVLSISGGSPYLNRGNIYGAPKMLDFLHCLCRHSCLQAGWDCGSNVRCHYDPKPRGNRPDLYSCDNPGTCICEGYGCGRADLIDSGEGYDACAEEYNVTEMRTNITPLEPIKEGTILYENDQLYTLGDTLLAMPDGSKLLINPNSVVTFTSPSPGKVLVDVQRGSARILKTTGEVSNVEVRIGETMMRPKGTEYIARWDGEAGSVAVVEGSLTVYNETAFNETISNETGPGITLEAGRQLELPAGKVSSYNLSADDGGLFVGIPLRELILDDSGSEPFGTYEATFADGKISEGWIWQDPGEDAKIETPESGILKVIVPDGNDLWGSPGYSSAQLSTAPRLLHKITGDFDLDGELQLQCNSSDYAATEFVIYSPGSYLGFLEPQQMKLDGLGEHYRILGGGWVRSAGLNKLSCLSWLTPQYSYALANLVHAQDAPNGSVLVKLVRRGDTWKTYWSLDGNRWNLSGRHEIEAPGTLWVGWVFKRRELGWLADEKATTTLKDVRLETAPLGSKAVPEWDMVQLQGAALPAGGSVQLSLNESQRGVVTAYRGGEIEGDFDAVLRFDAQNWTHQPDQCRQLSLIAEKDGKHGVYVGLYQSDDHSELRRYTTAIMLNGGWYYRDWDEAPTASSGWLRLVRQGGNFSTYYWLDCQWNQLDKFAETFSGPVYLGAQIDNQCEDAKSNGSLLVNFTWEEVRTGPGENWTPPDCRLLEPVPLPADLVVPDGLEGQMLTAPFDLGKLFFGHDGTAYIFSSQTSNGWMTSRYFDGHYGLDKMKLLALYLNGTSSTHIESPLLGGTNMKSGVELYTGFLVALDYWPDGGSLFGGLYELRPDGGYSKWNLSKDYSGLGDVIQAPDGGWYFSDFEADNVWHLPAKGKAEEPLITQGDRPRGLTDLAFDEAEKVLYALSWGGSNPYGSALEAYKMTNDGQAALVAKINESSTSPGGSIAISQKGPFGRGIYVSDPEGGSIFRVDDDGTLTPEITGLVRPGDMSFNPATGDLLVVCDERYLLKVGG
jgi:hypothetical protein